MRGVLTRDTTNLVHVLHDVLSRGLQVGEEWYPVRNGLNVVDSERESDRVGDRDQVENGVRGAAENHREDLCTEETASQCRV